MDDTTIIEINLRITLRQARYIRRKFHDWSKILFTAAKREYCGPAHDEHKGNAMMLQGLAVYLEEKIKEIMERCQRS